MRFPLVRLACLLIFSGPYCLGQVQSRQLDDGCTQLESKHLRLITDLPISDEIRKLPEIFDAALPMWQNLFGGSQDDSEELKAVAFLMGDRVRFQHLGYLTPETPNFAEGYQFGDRLFICEQPSDYYRRHLLLHEGTHWYMYRALGGAGAGWYMEGLAEYMATHRWDGQRLTLGVVPDHRDQVPYWGRLSVLREDFERDRAPSLRKIFEFFDREHRNVKPYAWSWAATQFFLIHPKSSEVIKQTFHPGLDYSEGINHQLLAELDEDWPQYCHQWSGFVSDLDYGVDPKTILPTWVPAKKTASRTDLHVQSNHGWQSSGILMMAGERAMIRAHGRITLARNSESKPWESEPQGISLQYQDGHKIGTLMAAVIPIHLHLNDQTLRWRSIPIGKLSQLEAPVESILYFKVNEHPGKLNDNSGHYSISVEFPPSK